MDHKNQKSITVIDHYDDDFIQQTNGRVMPVPAVAVSNRYVQRKKNITLSKRNLLIRDNRTCQYCGCHLKPNTATIDHVIPRSHYKKASLAHKWTNVVLACRPCNSKKDNKTPEQAGMKLLSTPYEPKGSRFYTGISAWKEPDEKWLPYIQQDLQHESKV